METNGIGGHIQCTERVYRQLSGRFNFTPRGEIEIKGKGPMSTYFLVGAR
jgi:adenylate cyclase